MAALEQSTQAISHVAESTHQASEGAKRTMSLSERGIGSMLRMVELVLLGPTDPSPPASAFEAVWSAGPVIYRRR